jgi:hypothetical protein
MGRGKDPFPTNPKIQKNKKHVLSEGLLYPKSDESITF